jgi:hypothetical protein
MTTIWLDILVFNLYLNYLILFVRSFKQLE